MVSSTANMPQSNIGSCLGPCISGPAPENRPKTSLLTPTSGNPELHSMFLKVGGAAPQNGVVGSMGYACLGLERRRLVRKGSTSCSLRLALATRAPQKVHTATLTVGLQTISLVYLPIFMIKGRRVPSAETRKPKKVWYAGTVLYLSPEMIRREGHGDLAGLLSEGSKKQRVSYSGSNFCTGKKAAAWAKCFLCWVLATSGLVVAWQLADCGADFGPWSQEQGEARDDYLREEGWG